MTRGDLQPSGDLTASLPRARLALLFMVMLVTAAGNTAMQSVMPAIATSLKVQDFWMSLAYTWSALLWMLCAPWWARKSDKRGRKAMMAIGLMGFIWIFSVALGLAYESWFLVNKGATPGKMVLSLQVARADGGQITWSLAIGRHFAKMLSGIILGIGYILVAFDGEKRALHDMICNTRVTKK